MSNRTRALCVATAIAAVALLTGPAAQQTQTPAVTFQVEVNFVDIDAVVTDERGNFVSDLSKDDFELFEDGKPQTIEAFSYIDITSPQPGQDFPGLDDGPILPDVRSTREPISGRVYVIVLDDLDISPLRTSETKQAARQFIEQYFTLGGHPKPAINRHLKTGN